MIKTRFSELQTGTYAIFGKLQFLSENRLSSVFVVWIMSSECVWRGSSTEPHRPMMQLAQFWRVFGAIGTIGAFMAQLARLWRDYASGASRLASCTCHRRALCLLGSDDSPACPSQPPLAKRINYQLFARRTVLVIVYYSHVSRMSAVRPASS